MSWYVEFASKESNLGKMEVGKKSGISQVPFSLSLVLIKILLKKRQYFGVLDINTFQWIDLES